jgi:hypothetical protein
MEMRMMDGTGWINGWVSEWMDGWMMGHEASPAKPDKTRQLFRYMAL